MPPKHRVLVVDDDRLVADTLSLVFQASGFEAEARYSAAEGLERARSFSPGLVLCDVCMPEADGLTLVDAMAAEMPGTRMLMFTAYSSSARRVQERSSQLPHPLRLLRKPCRPEVLLEEVTALLAASSLN